jgi:hypothetical protein
MELITSRPVGRPKVRWMDNVKKDIQAMNNWKKCAQDRNGSQLLSRPKLM